MDRTSTKHKKHITLSSLLIHLNEQCHIDITVNLYRPPVISMTFTSGAAQYTLHAHLLLSQYPY